MADASPLLLRALDPGIAAPEDATSERILDAALALAAASGVRNLTMDDVARRAGVGRMTVYRRFGDKERLIEALGVREVRRCLAELDAAAAPQAPIADQIAEGFAASLRIAREHPLLARLGTLEPETLLDALSDQGGMAFAAMRGFLALRLRAAQDAGVLGPVEVDEVAELLVRLALSFVLLPESAIDLSDEDRVRELARSVIAPMLSGA